MRVLAIISYDGRGYYGFERQKDLPTIQGEIEKALSKISGKPITIHGAGRTDRGVSARGQAISFDIDADLEALRVSMNAILPKDIHIESIEEKDMSFDARHSSKGKIYSYTLNHIRKDPLSPFESFVYLPNFNVDKYIEALRVFEGEHNFQNFTSKPIDKDGFIRKIEPIEITYDEEKVKAVFKANGFMTYQIRMMVGNAIKASIGKISIDDIRLSLETSERKTTNLKADPNGLILEKVVY